MTSLLSLLCELTQPLTNKQKKENNQTPTILHGTGRTKNNISSQESGSKMDPFCILLYTLSNLVKRYVKDYMKFDPWRKKNMLLCYLTARRNCFLSV